MNTPPVPPAVSATAPPVPVLTGEGRVFRYSYRRFLLPFLVFAVVFYPLLAVGTAYLLLLASGRTGPSPLWAFAVGGNIGVPANLIMGLMFIWLLPTRVHRNGLHSQSFWGTGVYLTWPEMQVIGKRTVLGFPYVVLQGAGGKTIWLSLRLDDLPVLRDLAREYGGEEHPLARWLTQNLR